MYVCMYVWVMSDSLWPHRLKHARLPCPSPTPRVCSQSYPSSRWCHPIISSSVILFSPCLQSFQASVFSNESTVHIRWPEYWSFNFSISPSNESCPTLCNPHGLYSPWNSPGQNTGVGSLSLLQGIFPTQGLNIGLPHCRWILYQLNHKGNPRILEWVALSLLQGIFPTQELNRDLLHCRRVLHQLSYQGNPSSEYSGLIPFSIDWFDLLAVQETLTLLQHHSLKASVLWHSALFMVWLSHPHDYWKNHSFYRPLSAKQCLCFLKHFLSGWGIHVTPWLIHVNVWQNPLKCCEVISLQLIKINEKKIKKIKHCLGLS